ncbi:MAG TPA: hypothetical protein VMP08_06965, partial [Anaerolineae bacterium]|nr:hypothetical protein [Anaerolineae bacterium]
MSEIQPNHHESETEVKKTPPETKSTDPEGTQIAGFAAFFKSYGIGLSLIVATLPIVISAFDLIPVFAATKNSLTIVTSFTSYLLVGFIFSLRHRLGRIYFGGHLANGKPIAYHRRLSGVAAALNLLPLVLLVIAIILFLRLSAIVN